MSCFNLPRDQKQYRRVRSKCSSKLESRAERQVIEIRAHNFETRSALGLTDPHALMMIITKWNPPDREFDGGGFDAFPGKSIGGAHSDRISIPPSQSKIVAPCWVTSLDGSLVKSGSLAHNVECREGQPRSYRALMWPLSQSRIAEKRNLPSAIASTMKT